MLILSIIISISLIISILIFMLAYSLGIKLFYRNKMTPFECGFDQKKKSRLPFSTQFFLITVIFLIFDVEFIILLPLSMYSPLTNLFSMQLSLITLLLILILGLLHEWLLGSLNWVK